MTSNINELHSGYARNIKIDVLKGLGMLIVVFGHMQLDPRLYALIFSFHMPLFFVISGILFKKTSIRKLFFSLVIPYVSLGIIILLCSSLYYGNGDELTYLLNLLLGSTVNHRFTPSPALWFISCLLVMKVIGNLLSNYIENPNKLLLISLACCLIGLTINHFIPPRLVLWNIDIAFFAMPFFLYGRAAYKFYTNQSLKQKLISITVGGLALLLLVKFNGMVNIFRFNYGHNIAAYYASGFIGTYLTFFLSELVSKNNKIKVALASFGNSNIVVLSIHMFIITIYYDFLGKLGLYDYNANNSVISSTAFSLIGFLVISLLCFYFYMLIKRFTPMLIGSKRLSHT